MTWPGLLEHLVALLVHPGLVAALVFGSVLETVAAWVLGSARSPLEAARSVVAGLAGVWRSPAAAVPALLLLPLAAAQIVDPSSPLPAAERNLVVAAIAVVAATWIAWPAAWGTPGREPRLALAGQVAWLVALLVPALQTQALRPQALGAIVIPELIPGKLAAGFLAVAVLPVVLRLLPEVEPAAGSAPPGAAAGRTLLWLPVCGLVVSVLVPPFGADAAGVASFYGLSLLTGLVGVLLARLVRAQRAGTTSGIYTRLAPLFAAFTVLVGVLTAAVR